MIQAHFTTVLWVTGAITMVPVLQFLLPKLGMKLLYQLDLTDEAGLFFARHWGLLAAAFGGALMYAAEHDEVRRVIVAAALVEKAGLVGLLALANVQGRPFAKGLRLAAAFDATCVLLYSWWFLS